MEKLNQEELETKINALNNTVVTLRLALSDVNCEKTKKALQVQITTYNESLRQFLYELSKRTKKTY